jgi:hypothetical protein
VTLLLLFAQMLGTVTPMFLFPHEVFTRIPLPSHPSADDRLSFPLGTA